MIKTSSQSFFIEGQARSFYLWTSFHLNIKGKKEKKLSSIEQFNVILSSPATATMPNQFYQFASPSRSKWPLMVVIYRIVTIDDNTGSEGRIAYNFSLGQ